jgi:hypothetical protein
MSLIELDDELEDDLDDLREEERGAVDAAVCIGAGLSAIWRKDVARAPNVAAIAMRLLPI